MDFVVKEITYKKAIPWIKNKHYAQRIPSISWAFGLFDNKKMIGVCTVGKPASPSLCKGICGEEFKSKVYELNRLVLEEGLPKNSASFFIGYILRNLKEEDLILVSYADEGMHHFGYVYQATNWFYTGKTKSRTDKYMPGNKHSRHYTDEYKHLRKVRSSKHRYVYFTGKSKKLYLNNLNYEIQEYPKGDPGHYDLGTRKKTKIIDTKNNEIFYE